VKKVPLTQGFVALIDDADYERVSQFKWSATRTKTMVYGIRKVRKPGGGTTSQLLHRFIMGVADRRIYIDHLDHDGLNCQRNNLRRCVPGENSGNVRKSRGNSQYRGVSWASEKGMWRACIRIERSIHLGYFSDEVEAALAYDEAARIRFGVFAHCNFPLQE
jgi:hypothetical protein